jgi:TATA-box binding protein (TBP) (component of TFIID and TFIIIB)
MGQQPHFPVKINTVNFIAKTAIKKPFSLDALAARSPFLASSQLRRIPIYYNSVKFSIFTTGTVVCRAAHSFHELIASFAWLRRFLANFGLTFSEPYQITNIVAVARIAPRLDLSELAPLLNTASYDPIRVEDDYGIERAVDAIVYYFSPEKPRNTALIFPSGRATLTGFTSIESLNAKAIALSSLLFQLAREHTEILTLIK